MERGVWDVSLTLTTSADSGSLATERGVGLTEAALARGICASCRKTGYLASSEVVKATAKSSGLPVIDR